MGSNRYHGYLFEQWVGLELIRLHRQNPLASIWFWRDHNGPEVDWIVKVEESLIPIEVKWTQKPTSSDCRHLITFLKEYPQAKEAFLVCQIARPRQIHEGITAIPWQNLSSIF